MPFLKLNELDKLFYKFVAARGQSPMLRRLNAS